ncbi:uncharacterized protein C1orf21 homolog isoform X1 [Myotis myotis]|uniref:uncharacterized protein C1orf21 homolog isoform X1 n=1 Tax=Myotis myotis TaxID=51298 RepID=UPI001749FF64|nr:uncharacterized protein C1orf21 homolog isoform X1 [Myotis myotis]
MGCASAKHVATVQNEEEAQKGKNYQNGDVFGDEYRIKPVEEVKYMKNGAEEEQKIAARNQENLLPASICPLGFLYSSGPRKKKMRFLPHCQPRTNSANLTGLRLPSSLQTQRDNTDSVGSSSGIAGGVTVSSIRETKGNATYSGH